LSAGGLLPEPELPDAWAIADQIPIHLEPPSSGLEIIQTALRLRRSSAYDAAYIVLARNLGASLWTLDGPLARNAASLDLPVRLVE
jgi:predicted nucleic acid-binding protein